MTLLYYTRIVGLERLTALAQLASIAFKVLLVDDGMCTTIYLDQTGPNKLHVSYKMILCDSNTSFISLLLEQRGNLTSKTKTLL